MTTSGLASPLPAVRPREVRAEDPARPIPALFQPRQQPPFLRRYGRALALSLFVHLLLVVFSPRLVLFDVPAGDGGAMAPGGAEPGTYIEISLAPPSEIVPLSEISPAAAQPVVTTGAVPLTTGGPVSIPTAAPTAGSGVQVAPGAGAGGGEAAGPGIVGAAPSTGVTGSGGGAGSAAATLRPGYRDSRLYVQPPLIRGLDKTAEERYAEHLASRMAAVRDSMAAEAGRADMTPDWVHTDGSGNRWGLSDQGLHLGPITIPRQLIPNPRATGDTRSQQDARERQRQREEIQRQEEDRARREAQEERNRAAQESRGADR